MEGLAEETLSGLRPAGDEGGTSPPVEIIGKPGPDRQPPPKTASHRLEWGLLPGEHEEKLLAVHCRSSRGLSLRLLAAIVGSLSFRLWRTTQACLKGQGKARGGESGWPGGDKAREMVWWTDSHRTFSEGKRNFQRVVSKRITQFAFVFSSHLSSYCAGKKLLGRVWGQGD